jgi:hypothetical protein
VTTGALVYGDVERHLRFNEEEHPVALQLGGSDPADLATSAKLGQAMYAAAQAAQQAPSEAGGPSDHAESNGESSTSDDDVVDAEIVDDDQTSSEAR